MESVGFDLQQDAVLTTLIEDVAKTSQIEGERLDLEQVRSSVARRLGIEIPNPIRVSREVEGVVDMMLDATHRFSERLSVARLCAWQASLFPTGRSGLRPILVGRWRTEATGPMQVVSGPIGRERVHFEAPSANRLDQEVSLFLRWFNSESGMDDVLKAGLAHLWFVTLHPFDDGNGRIARAISDMLLARSEKSSRRYYSMSSQISRERRIYYEFLERTQKGSLEVTAWLEWFLRCLGRAIDRSRSTLDGILSTARFWQSVRSVPVNHRQRTMLSRLLDGFRGKLTTSKWAKIAKCSQDTALRDITGLLDQGILVRGPDGGRSTSYLLVRDEA